MTSQPKPISTGWRRYLRLSVRELTVTVLLIGVGLGWTAQLVRRAQVQREAVAAIERAGGSVKYDWWKRRRGNAFTGGKPWAPKWAVDLIGVDYFGCVTAVAYELRGAELLVAETEKGLTSTESAAGQTAIITRAQPLKLVTSRMGDSEAATAPLKALTQLFYLDLRFNDLDDAGLARLKSLTELSYLDLSGTRVTDAGLAHLSGLAKLSELKLGNTRVTDAGLANLTSLTSLSELNLNDTRVSDAGLPHLKGLNKLKAIELDLTQVTDAGLVHLRGLTNLSYLGLQSTRVTNTGMNKLQRDLPSLVIRH